MGPVIAAVNGQPLGAAIVNEDQQEEGGGRRWKQGASSYCPVPTSQRLLIRRSSRGRARRCVASIPVDGTGNGKLRRR